MDPDLPQAQNMGIRSPMSEGSPNSERQLNKLLSSRQRKMLRGCSNYQG